jgi:competence protein ComEC
VEGADLIAHLAEEEGAELYLITEQRSFSFGKASLSLYPPLGSGTSNEEGLFALCSSGDFDVLITGDADRFVERMLVTYCPLPDVEVLMAGHHGSRHSTCDGLLDAVCPELAVISVGYNAYGHPAPEVLERLEARKIRILRTDEKGTVTIRLKDGMIAVQ